MIAARKFISDLLFIKYLVLRWEINIRKGGKRDRTEGEKNQKEIELQQEKRVERLQGWLGCPEAIRIPISPSKHLHMVGTVALGTCGCS